MRSGAGLSAITHGKGNTARHARGITTGEDPLH